MIAMLRFLVIETRERPNALYLHRWEATIYVQESRVIAGWTGAHASEDLAVEVATRLAQRLERIITAAVRLEKRRMKATQPT